MVHFIRSPGVAMFLSFAYPGAGQIYAHQVARGMWIAFAPPILLALYLFSSLFMAANTHTHPAGFWFGILAYFVFFIWQIMDAGNCATNFNRSAGRGAGGRPGRRRRYRARTRTGRRRRRR